MKLDVLQGGLVTVPQAASYLSLSKSKVYDLMNSGLLPFVKIGGARRLQKRSLDDFISEHSVGGWKQAK